MNRTPLKKITCVLAMVLIGAGSAAAQIHEQEVDLLVGKSMIVTADKRVEQVVVVNPTVADAEVISPTQVVLIGRQLGVTDVIMQYEDGTAAVHAIEVMIDEFQLQGRLSSLFGPGLTVDSTNGVVVLRGDVDNVEEAVQIESFMNSTGLTYLDMTRVPGIQQVLLKVKIAEVSRRGLRELGFGASVGGSSFRFAGSTGGNGLVNPGTVTSSIPTSANLFAGIPGADLDLFINALTTNNYVRLLAEPNLVAISGEEATFLVGGEFPIPVVQGTSVGVGSTTTIEYKEVGVRLNFRPEVLGENRIRLQVAPEVSELSETFGAEIPGTSTKAKGVSTRRSKTTVEMRSGQTFALAGLLKTTTEAERSSLPVLGDLPLIGSLFRSIRYVENKTELVVLVTAELVEPIDPLGTLAVPGFMHVRPNDWQLFMDGKIDGTVIAPLPETQAKTLRALGIDGLVGPGAWRRFDETPEPLRPDPTGDSSTSAPSTVKVEGAA